MTDSTSAPLALPTPIRRSRAIDELLRLDWAVALAGEAYGATAGILVDRPEHAVGIDAVLPEGWKALEAPSPAVRRLYTISRNADGGDIVLSIDGRREYAHHDPRAVLELLRVRLKLYVAEWASDWLFVHAGTVSHRGAAIVIPGVSHSGKTSLVAALVRAGATYYSDEFAILDRRGRVHPYLVPLGVRGPLGRQVPTPPEALGASGGEPLPIGAVVLTRYERGARWQPESVSRGEAVLDLLANSPAARRTPAGALAILGRALAGAAILRGRRGDAEETAAALLAAL